MVRWETRMHTKRSIRKGHKQGWVAKGLGPGPGDGMKKSSPINSIDTFPFSITVRYPKHGDAGGNKKITVEWKKLSGKERKGSYREVNRSCIHPRGRGSARERDVFIIPL